MNNLVDIHNNKIEIHAVVKFGVTYYNGIHGFATGMVNKVLKRHVEIIYRNRLGEFDYIKVKPENLVILNYVNDDEFVGYDNMLIDKYSFFKVW